MFTYFLYFPYLTSKYLCRISLFILDLYCFYIPASYHRSYEQSILPHKYARLNSIGIIKASKKLIPDPLQEENVLYFLFKCGDYISLHVLPRILIIDDRSMR